MSREVNLLGGFYVSKALPWSAQDTVNWLPVASASGGTRSPFKLKSAPGLRPLSVLMVVTTPTYPLEVIESMNSNAAITRGETLAPPLDEINSAAVLTGGELRDTLRTYVYTEEMNSAARLDSGALVTPLRSYTNWPAEEMTSAAALTGGLLDDVLITYSRYQPEELNSAAFLTGGSLS